ncbi:MAG: VOC family protein [Novosphingobium sp.]
MAITGVSHMGLCVSNLDAALKFYCDILGFEKVVQFNVDGSTTVQNLLELDKLKMSLTFVERDGLRIELIDIANPRPTGGGKGAFNRLGYTHLSVKVADWDAELDRLRAAGVDLIEETVGTEPDSNSRFAFILDPDGNRVELFGLIDETGRAPWDFSVTV